MSVTGSHTRSPVSMGTASANVACLAAGFGLGHSWPQQQHMVAWSGLISSHSGQVLACTLAGATAASLLLPTLMSTWSTGPCLRQLPAKSRIRQLSLPSALRVPRPTIDRKSTRLNSSHLGISYAVFCLKKKTEHMTS